MAKDKSTFPARPKAVPPSIFSRAATLAGKYQEKIRVSDAGFVTVSVVRKRGKELQMKEFILERFSEGEKQWIGAKHSDIFSPTATYRWYEEVERFSLKETAKLFDPESAEFEALESGESEALE